MSGTRGVPPERLALFVFRIEGEQAPRPPRLLPAP